MPSDPIVDARRLAVGDIVMVSKELTNRKTGQPYWWRTFRVVTYVDNFNGVDTAILRMDIDTDKDFRPIIIPNDKEIVTKLAEHEVPQGVAAMLMKGIARGTIKLGD